MISGTIGLLSASTISRTSLSLRSRAPRIDSRPRASSSAIVSALIIPRSATRHIRVMPKRSRRRVTTGNSAFTSVALPGQVSEQIGRPSPSRTTPTTTWRRSGDGPSTCHADQGSRHRRRRTATRWCRQHNGEIAEQVASAFEQRLLDQVFDATRCSRCPALIASSSPSRPSPDRAGAAPSPRRHRCDRHPATSRRHGSDPETTNPMQDAGKHRPLERKAQAAAFGELLNHRATASLLPQTTEDHRCTDAYCRAGLERS